MKDEYAHLSDDALLAAVRSGDTEAYSVLWNRYKGAGFQAAQSFSSTFDADDLVAEAHARILRAFQNGAGPTSEFRAYLITTIRNIARTWGRSEKESTVEDFEALFDATPVSDFSDDSLDKLILQRAFKSLSTRWQLALWIIDVEGGNSGELGKQLGIKPNAVGSLIYRAREGFKQAYIAAHLDEQSTQPECRNTIQSLAAFERNALTSRGMRKVEKHLATCETCLSVRAESSAVAQKLRSAVPATILAGGFAAYAALGPLGSSSASAATIAQSSLSTGAKGAAKSFFAWSPKTILAAAASTTIVAGATVASIAVFTPPPTPESSSIDGDRTTPAPASPSVSPDPAEPKEPSSTASSPVSHTTQPGPTVYEPDPEQQLWTFISNGSPAAPVFTAAKGAILNGSTAAIDGTALPGAAVTVYVSGSGGASGQIRVSTVTANEAGAWSLPLENTSDGEYVARAYQVDSEQRRSPLSSTEFGVQWGDPKAAPVVTDIDSSDGRLSPIVSGTGVAGNTVVVSLNGVTASQRIADDGTWHVLAARGALVGENTVTALQQSPKSRAQSLPSEPVTFQLNTPSVSVTAEDDDTMLLTVLSLPNSSVRITDGVGVLAHEVSPTNGSDALRLAAMGGSNPWASVTKVKIRYTSADGDRVGPAVWQDL